MVNAARQCYSGWLHVLARGVISGSRQPTQPAALQLFIFSANLLPPYSNRGFTPDLSF